MLEDANRFRQITTSLFELGVKPHFKGFEYLVCALSLVIDEPQYLQNVTKRLYPEVARLCGEGVKPSCVERSMRIAIENCFLYGDKDFQYTYFGACVNPEKGKTTNAEFIACVAQKIRLCETAKKSAEV